MAPHPVRETNGGAYRVVESKSSTMSSLMCCTSKRSQQAMTYKESQKKFLWLDPNRWSGQKKEKVRQLKYLEFTRTAYTPGNHQGG